MLYQRAPHCFEISASAVRAPFLSMHFPHLHACLYVVLLASSVSAVPSRLLSIVDRRAPSNLDGQGTVGKSKASCNDLTNELSSSCWNTLQIDDYLTGWRKSIPDCAVSGGAGSDCCFFATEPWSTCFLRLATGSAGSDCSVLSQFSCNPKLQSVQDLNSSLSPAIKAQVYYVTAAIFKIHWLFTSYYHGIDTRHVSVVLFGTNSHPALSGADTDTINQIYQAFGVTAGERISSIQAHFPIPQLLGLSILNVRLQTSHASSFPES